MAEQNWQEVRVGPDAAPAGAPQLSSACVAAVVGIAAVFGLIGFFFPTLRPHSLSWRSLLLVAVGLLAFSGGVSAGIARWIGSRGAGTSSGMTEAAWMGALWIPAWVLGLQLPSILTVLPALFCAASVAWSLKQYTVERGRISAERPAGALIWIDDSKPLVRVILPSLVVAVIAEAALIAMVGERYRSASLFAAGCAAALMWQVAPRASARSISTTQKIVLLNLAFLFTMAVLLPYLKGQRLFSTGDLLAKNALGGHRGEKGPEPANGSDGYSGIILLPLTETPTTLVAPRRKDSASTGGRPAQPMVIPFDGVYWYFKAPDRRPRPSARIVRGSSTKAVIRSSDRYPLLMEAHQRLGSRIDLVCCSGVQVVLQNADHRPGAIALELWFTDSLQPGSRSYLGAVTIPSSEDEGDAKNLPPEETMAFAVPASAVGREFDEITVVVRPAPERARAGAQVAIHRFVLLP
ncbi:MAG TPA: hypothetical protein VIX90_06830 [Edaphobacter sp.]